jgi:hypothetical protein
LNIGLTTGTGGKIEQSWKKVKVGCRYKEIVESPHTRFGALGMHFIRSANVFERLEKAKKLIAIRDC